MERNRNDRSALGLSLALLLASCSQEAKDPPSPPATPLAKSSPSLTACVGVEEVGVPVDGFRDIDAPDNSCGRRSDPSAVPFCDLDANTVTFEVTHFSSYRLGAFENRPPFAICQSLTLETEPGTCSASGSIDAGSVDPDGDVLTITQTPAGPFALGETVVSLAVTDEHGLTASCAGTVRVIDAEPPSVSVGRSPELWPPDHRQETLALSDCQIAIEDACAGPMDLETGAAITCVSSDEPDNGPGDGNTPGDIEIVDARTVRLRAERSGAGDGRVYRIGFRVQDPSSNPAHGTCVVRVAHDQSGVTATDSGEVFSVCRQGVE